MNKYFFFVLLVNSILWSNNPLYMRDIRGLTPLMVAAVTPHRGHMIPQLIAQRSPFSQQDFEKIKEIWRQHNVYDKTERIYVTTLLEHYLKAQKK